MGAKRAGVYGLLITLAGVAFFIVGLFGLSPTEQNEQNRQNEQNEQNVKEFPRVFSMVLQSIHLLIIVC